MNIKTVKTILIFINFFAFATVTTRMGGSAGNGKIENGRYYLGEHGHYTEVSQTTFRRLQLYEYSMFATHALGILAGVFLSYILPKLSQTAEGARPDEVEIERAKARRARLKRICLIGFILGIANFLFVTFISDAVGAPHWYKKSLEISDPLTILGGFIYFYLWRKSFEVES